jgi:hypothetical protein
MEKGPKVGTKSSILLGKLRVRQLESGGIPLVRSELLVATGVSVFSFGLTVRLTLLIENCEFIY